MTDEKMETVYRLQEEVRELQKRNEELRKVVENIRRIHSPGTTPGCSVCDALCELDERGD